LSVHPHRTLRSLTGFATIAAVVAALYLAGVLDFIEMHLQDLRSSVLSHPASGEVVLVTIDPKSLRALPAWPWPRQYHAEVLERLIAAGAARVGVNIDFSTRSNPEGDRRLAAALAKAGPGRVALPIFRQWHDDALRIVPIDTMPLSSFRQNASLASVNVAADPDGLVRRVAVAQHHADGPVPTIPTWLFGGVGAADDEAILVDFSIDPATIPRLSFVDVLQGDFDPVVVRGKRVLVGATALELGDEVGVPRFHVLPGTVFQALATDTLVQGRSLHRIGGWPVALSAVVAALIASPLLIRLRCRASVAAATGVGLIIVLGTFVAQPAFAITIDTSPTILSILSSAVLGQLCRQAWSLRIQDQMLRRKDVIMSRIVESAFDGIMTFDEEGRVLLSNLAAERMFRCPPGKLVGMALNSLIPERSGRPLAATTPDPGPLELTARRCDGGEFPVEIVLSTADHEGEPMRVAVVRDISKRKADQELARRALHDPLTGLPNRILLQNQIDEAVGKARGSRQVIAILLVDLDRFKQINDTLGHQAGDSLLCEVGRRMSAVLRGDDMVARIGGDEFAVLLACPMDVVTASAIAQRIARALRQPFFIDDMSMDIGASIGISLHPQHGQSASQLLQCADAAMYAAKRAHAEITVYDHELELPGADCTIVRSELRRAIERDELVLHYQPKFDLETLQFIGFEALVRWEHPDHGLVPPAKFIPAAERTGLIRPLTMWALESALRQQGAWRHGGYDVTVAVNLSVPSLQDLDLPGALQRLCMASGVPPERLVLEITESALISDPTSTMKVLAGLGELGCRLSLDDFGAGYSSLAHLQKIPINELKIDRSFVLSMVTERSATIIVRSIINLAHNLGLEVVAEGVEDYDTAAELASLGCDQVQEFSVWQTSNSTSVPPMAQRVVVRARGRRRPTGA
jgi:diguanylate cyclase (GGDEF)-like protein/PAS domain S-box-containing protein